MNGASASTVVATMRMSPVRHRKIASGISHRLCDSLCQSPLVSCAIVPPVLPSTMNPRLIRPRFLITMIAPTGPPGPALHCGDWSALDDARVAGHQHIDPAPQERGVALHRAIDD